MSKLRFLLAFSSAAAMPVVFFVRQRRREQTPVEKLRGRAAALASDASDLTRDRLGALTGAARGGADTVAEHSRGSAASFGSTALRLAGSAASALAAAPRIIPFLRHDPDGPSTGDGSEDWMKYPQSIGRS